MSFNDDPQWWRSAVVYQIYPRSFADANGEAVAVASGIWQEINYVNLVENILPTRERANLILTKGNQHAIEQIKLRK